MKYNMSKLLDVFDLSSLNLSANISLNLNVLQAIKPFVNCCKTIAF